MITALVCLSLAQTSASTLTAADFFPLPKGIRRTYQEQGGRNTITVDEIGDTVEVGGKPAVHVTTWMNTRRIGEAYYRVETDGVYLVAHQPTKPLNPPIPLFKFNGAKTTWDMASNVTEGGTTVDMITSKGSAQLGGIKDVLGKQVETLEVVVNVVVGDLGPTEKVTQTYVFAKGFGLISLTSTSAITKKRKPAQSTLQLIKVEEPFKEG